MMGVVKERSRLLVVKYERLDDATDADSRDGEREGESDAPARNSLRGDGRAAGG
jgi:hypothetical protein